MPGVLRGALRIALVVLAGAAPASGQEGDQSLRAWLRPRATLRSAAWSSSRTVDNRGPLFGSEVWADIAPRFSERIGLRASGWAGIGSVLGASDADAALRELYAEIGFRAAEFRLGKQIVAWGRADAVNPTDIVSPRDLTMLVTDDDDQKSGVPAIRAALTFGGTTVSALWIAGFEASTLPLGSIPSSTRIVQPSRSDEVAQGALRMEHAGGRVDWSVSWFSGLDLVPDAAIRATPTTTALELAHHRLRVLGADAATTLGRYGLRAEAALLLTDDASGRDAEIKNSTLFAVIGADRTFGSYFNVNVQYLVRYVRGFTPPGSISDPPQRETALTLARVSQQLRQTQHGGTVRLSNQWWHETLKAEVSGVFFAPPWQVLIRPRITYAVSDRWQLVAGADHADGGDGTLFRSLRKNSLAFLEVRLGL